jgi:sortase A
VEAVAWAAGIVCLAYVGVRHLDSVNSNRESMRRFTELRTAEHRRGGSVDVSLWSEARITAWQNTRDLAGPTPLAILRIPRIHLEVPVLEGTDELTLNRAVGHIEDTARPGVDGNAGIAGHRDGFFRGLMNLVAGDAIELESLDGTESYRIERTWIVNPDDVSPAQSAGEHDEQVISHTERPSRWLTTCRGYTQVSPLPSSVLHRSQIANSSISSLQRKLLRRGTDAAPIGNARS